MAAHPTTLLFTCGWGPADPERASLPLVAATVAVTTGQPTIVLCTGEGVRLCVREVPRVAAPGLPAVADLLAELLAGGQVWACASSATPRGIGQPDLRTGIRLVGAARLVEELAAGASAIALS